ncbi:hypothetical protein [Agarivorans sp. JK6]|uniref:hypothetical protein n=1 Tax=Agarivorans sp. JK6 TaxID=2997426 RepID=UPI003873AC78
MLDVQKDEFIHSYIYRTHVLNGISDLSNIITSKGEWSSFPKLLKGTMHLYQPIDDSLYLHLLRDINRAEKTDKIFNNPVAYRFELECFFGKRNGKVRRQRNLPIKYCLECIQRHIKNCGYGIIIVTWFDNSFCPIHKTNLYIAKPKNRNEAIQALNCIYRGIHPEAYEKLSRRSEHFHDLREYSHKNTCDYIAPCLSEELYTFISENFKDFSVGMLGPRHRFINSLSKNNMMIMIYEAVKNSNYKPFKIFWNSFSEIKRIDAGVINRKSITEEMFKNSMVDCQNCKHLSCFSNLKIMPPRPDERLVRRCELNYSLLFNYLRKKGTSNYSEIIEIMKKMSTQEKILALSNFQESRFDQIY